MNLEKSLILENVASDIVASTLRISEDKYFFFGKLKTPGTFDSFSLISTAAVVVLKSDFLFKSIAFGIIDSNLLIFRTTL